MKNRNTNVYQRKYVYPTELILTYLATSPDKKKKIVLDGCLVNTGSQRLVNFKKHGIVCANCGMVGEFFALERVKDGEAYHLNLYGKKGDEDVLMTADHIIPLSKGGDNAVYNLQTLCKPCNEKKSNKYDEKA